MGWVASKMLLISSFSDCYFVFHSMAEVCAMSLGFRFSQSQDIRIICMYHQINAWCFSVFLVICCQLMAVGVTVF